MKKLLITLGLSALLLLGVNLGFSSLRAEKAAQELDFMLHTLLPGSTSFQEEAYTGEDETIRSVYKAENGYVMLTATEGYAGPLSMMVGVNRDGLVTGVVVRQMEETWGLGAQALDNVDFLAQFLKTSGEAAVGSTVDAISGATVTSKAVTRCVNSAVAFVTGADAASGATSWGG